MKNMFGEKLTAKELSNDINFAIHLHKCALEQQKEDGLQALDVDKCKKGVEEQINRVKEWNKLNPEQEITNDSYLT